MIDKYSFGRITIDGRIYDADVLIYPDRINDDWWRKEGHRLQLAGLSPVSPATHGKPAWNSTG